MMDEMGHADPGLPLGGVPGMRSAAATTKKAAPRALGSALSLVNRPEEGVSAVGLRPRARAP